jgi:hypothetical protein
MTSAEYWDTVRLKSGFPDIEDPAITLPLSGLKRAITRAYEAGARHQAQDTEAAKAFSLLAQPEIDLPAFLRGLCTPPRT